MKRDDKRRRDAQDHVVVEPVSGVALLHQPRPVLAQRVEEDDQEHEHTQPSQLDPNHSAGAQGGVFWRERPVGGTEGVVAETVYAEGSDQRRKKKISCCDAGAVAAFVIPNLGNGRGNRSISAHFAATFSSVLTENCL